MTTYACITNIYKGQAMLTVLSLFIFLSGCRQLVEDEFPAFTRAPVVNSIITAGEPITFNLSFTGSIDTADLDYVEDAEVLLYVDGELGERLSYAGEGNYTTEILAEPQKVYSCAIHIAGFETITCSQTLPLPDSVYNIEGKFNGYKDEEGSSYPSITFTFSNDPSVTKYYEVVLRKVRDDGSDNILRHVQNTDPVLLAEGVPLSIFSTEAIETEAYTMTINYHGGNYGLLIIEFRSITFDYYQFIKQRYLYESGRYPEIAGGVATVFPLHSNIQNCYGIFAGYSVARSDTEFVF